MGPLPTSRVSLALLPLFIFAPAGMSQQKGDVFSTNTENGSACQQARANEQALYDRNMRAIEQRYEAAAPHAPGDLSAVRRNADEQSDENTRHSKALDDLDDGVCSPLRPTDSTPCGMAMYQEEVQYQRNLTAIAKKELDAQNEDAHKRNHCGSDPNCPIAVQSAGLEKIRQFAAERNAENTRHMNAQARIHKETCALHGGISQSGGSPPGTSGSPDRGPAAGRDDGGLPLPPNVRKQLLQGAAEMDRLMTKGQNNALAATNRFFDCLTEAVKADLLFLAQPRYLPASQIATALHDGTWRYLTSNAYDNNNAMFQSALQSLRRLQSDPACWFGQAAPGATAAAATHLAGAAAEAAEVQNAANAAVRIANENAERRAAYGNSSRSRPARGTPNPINRFNPECAPNMCFPSALAQDLTWETGDPYWAKAYKGNVEIRIVNGVPKKVYNITHQPTVEGALRGLYGNKKLKGPALAPWRAQNQLEGKPSLVTDRSGKELTGGAARRLIESDLLNAGNDSRGLVFLEYPPTAAEPEPIGHVINVRNVGGRIEFPDASNSNIDASSFFAGTKQVLFYRTN